MPPRKQYGKTPWGKAFLDAIGRLDANGRLQRGKTIANTGKVLKFSVANNTVDSRVKGNYQPYYSVKLTMRDFDEAQKQKVYGVIQANPLFLGDILNGQLPEALLQALTAEGTHLVPMSWGEILGGCNCPDNLGSGTYGHMKPVGAPCKHMAATYFMITAEVDKDPFTLFQLRGIRLAEHFAVSAAAQNAVPYPLAAEEELLPGAGVGAIAEDEIDDLGAAEPLSDSEDGPSGAEEDAAAAVDGQNSNTKPWEVSVRKLPLSSGFILSCLSPETVFNSAVNYHGALGELYDHVAKSHKKLLELELPQEAEAALGSLEPIWQHAELLLKLSGRLTGSVRVTATTTTSSGSWEAAVLKPTASSPGGPASYYGLYDAMRLLLRLPVHPGCSRSFLFLRWAAHAAAALFRACAFVPDVLPLDPKAAKWSVVYKPLAASPEVQRLLDDLVELYPGPVDGGGVQRPAANAETPPRRLAAPAAVAHTLTAMLSCLVFKSGFMHKKNKSNPPLESLVFFKGEVYQALGSSQKTVAASVCRWAGVFDMIKLDLDLMVTITQENPAASAAPDGPHKLALSMAKRTSTGISNGGSSSGSTERAWLSPVELMSREPGSKAGVLKLLSALSAHLPGLDGLLKGKKHIRLDGDVLERFILGTADLLRALGVQMVLPKAMKALLRPRPTVRARPRDGQGSAVVQGVNGLEVANLLHFDWQVAIGDETMTVEEFKRVAAQGRKLVFFKGHYVKLDAAEVKALLKQVSSPVPKIGAMEVIRAVADPANSLVSLPPDVKAYMEHLLSGNNASTPPPEGLRCTLRPYQESGFRWLVRNAETGMGSILADDMGLGKTAQTIAALLHLEGTGALRGPALVVAPTSLLSNWEREVGRFAPGLRTFTFYGGGRSIDKLKAAVAAAPSGNKGNKPLLPASLRESEATAGDGEEPSAKRPRTASDGCRAHIVFTSYGTLRSESKALSSLKWGGIIIDEAQAIKNASSQVAAAVKGIKAPVRIALSGTPVENRLAEMHSLFDFVMPGYLGTPKQFRAEFAKPIEAEHDTERAEALRRTTAPFLLRRLKTDKTVISDLPSKVVQDDYTGLAVGQAAMYEAVVQDHLDQIERAERDQEGRRKPGLVLNLLTALKQICNHPANYSKDQPMDVSSSGKSEMLVELLRPVMASGEKVLIFTQYVRMGGILCSMLEGALGVKPLFLHGGLDRKGRDAVVRRFEQDPASQIFVLSTKAGGVGLNLTAANHVVHYDLWWNPAVENQATDRAFRIGQTRTVFVHRLICRSTFEEKIDAMIRSKRELSDLTVASGETWIGALSADELRDLFELRNVGGGGGGSAGGATAAGDDGA